MAQAFNPLLDELEGATHLPGLHYEQGEIIGQGGFGVVYRYHHRLLGMDFAVKVFAPAFSEGGEGHLERFFREARILFALEHPNIVRVHDVGLLGRRPYIRMEMVQGRSLEQVIKQHGRIAPRHALRVVVEIAEALHHAHTVARVVHRDLRPSNVLVSKEPRRRVRLIDFGLGVFIEEEIVSRITREGERAVGGHFTAPELTANPRLLDPRSDIYSLGALWYTLLTGRPPAGINPGVALAAVDGISEVYADTLLQCLADVEHRTRSAEALVEQLRAL
nr:serine/threonine-protein kinase [Longimicrobium terrae]